MGIGTYVGTFIHMDEGSLTIQETLDDGTPYGRNAPEPGGWDWGQHSKAYRKAQLLDLQPGDLVEVEVEFEYYTIVHVRSLELDPRRLLDRIKVLEERLAELNPPKLSIHEMRSR